MAGRVHIEWAICLEGQDVYQTLHRVSLDDNGDSVFAYPYIAMPSGVTSFTDTIVPYGRVRYSIKYAIDNVSYESNRIELGQSQPTTTVGNFGDFYLVGNPDLDWLVFVDHQFNQSLIRFHCYNFRTQQLDSISVPLTLSARVSSNISIYNGRPELYFAMSDRDKIFILDVISATVIDSIDLNISYTHDPVAMVGDGEKIYYYNNLFFGSLFLVDRASKQVAMNQADDFNTVKMLVKPGNSNEFILDKGVFDHKIRLNNNAQVVQRTISSSKEYNQGFGALMYCDIPGTPYYISGGAGIVFNYETMQEVVRLHAPSLATYDHYRNFCYDKINQIIYAVSAKPDGSYVDVFNKEFRHLRSVEFPFQIAHITASAGQVYVFYHSNIDMNLLMQQIQL